MRLADQGSVDSRAPGEPDSDQTAKARIRDAAITLFAHDGVAATSVRAIAAQAGVSPALVIHHFGSKDALRVACDMHVAAVIRDKKSSAMNAGLGIDVTAALRSMQDGPPLTRYLARTLVDGSPHVAEIVDEMVRDAVAYMADGTASGVLRPTDYPYERAAVLTVWSLGALVLHEHLERLVGVDLLTLGVDGDADATAYMAPALEMFAGGLISAEVAANIRQALTVDEPGQPPTDTPKEGS